MPKAKSSYFEEIIPVFSPQNEFLPKGRMDPAGFEPASATMTECHVPITLRALSECLGVIEQVARLSVTILHLVSRNEQPDAELESTTSLWFAACRLRSSPRQQGLSCRSGPR